MTVPQRLKAGNVRNAGNVAGDSLQWIRQPMCARVCVTNIEQKHPETPTDCISKMDATCESLVGKPIRSRASLHKSTLELWAWESDFRDWKKQLMSSRSLPESTNTPTAAHEHKHTPDTVHHFLAFCLSRILAAPSVPASRPLALWLITNKSPTVTTRRAVFLSTSPSLSSSFSPTSLLLLWHFRWPSSSSSCSHCSGLNWRIAHSLALNLFFSKFY